MYTHRIACTLLCVHHNFVHSIVVHFVYSCRSLHLLFCCLQFLSDAMSALFQLLLDVQTPDTKMKVLNTLSLLLERMGVAIQPHLSSLLQYLPQLWVESADASSSMLRCIILTTLNNIVKGLGPLSVNLHSFVIPVLQLATDVKEASNNANQSCLNIVFSVLDCSSVYYVCTRLSCWQSLGIYYVYSCTC